MSVRSNIISRYCIKIRLPTNKRTVVIITAVLVLLIFEVHIDQNHKQLVGENSVHSETNKGSVSEPTSYANHYFVENVGKSNKFWFASIWTSMKNYIYGKTFYNVSKLCCT